MTTAIKTEAAPLASDFTTTVPIKLEMIRNLLCCAFEGGSNYWCLIDKVVYPPGFKKSDYAEGGKGQDKLDGHDYWHWSEIIPTQVGGALIITSKEGDVINEFKKWRLDREAIQRGLEVMRVKVPHQFANFLAENEDGDTGDCFLQCCLFGEVVYG